MANNKEPNNYTNGDHWELYISGIRERLDKKAGAEKKAISGIEDAELELDAKNQKNLSDKRANDDTTRLQYDKQKFEALVDHISKIKELKTYKIFNFPISTRIIEDDICSYYCLGKLINQNHLHFPP